MFRRGVGVPQNYELARGWYLQAADQGNASAFYALGDIYYHGLGVPSINRLAPIGMKRLPRRTMSARGPRSLLFTSLEPADRKTRKRPQGFLFKQPSKAMRSPNIMSRSCI